MKHGECGRKISDSSVTLGRVFNELNTGKATLVARRISLQGTFHYASRHEAINGPELKGSPDALQYQIKTMRRSLQAELKNKAAIKKPSRSSSRRRTRDFGETANRVETPVSVGMSDSVSRVSSAFSRDFVDSFAMIGNERVMEKLDPSSVDKKSEYTSSFYGRHMRTSLPEQMYNFPDTVEHVVDKKGFFKRDSPLRLDTDSPKGKSKDTGEAKNQNSESLSLHEKVCNCDTAEVEENSLSTNMNDCSEGCSPKEKEFLVQMKDPQLKESLRKIIRRRRDSVRFIPSSTDCRKISENDVGLEKKQSLSSVGENVENSDSESVFTGTDNGSQRPSSALSTTAREQTHEILSTTGTLTSESCRVEGGGSLTKSSTGNKLRTPNAHPVSRGNRRLSSARSSVSGLSRAVGVASLCSKRKPAVLTEETRVIRPATAKSALSGLLRQKSSHFQLPESTVLYQDNYHLSSEEKATMREKQMIREFLFMYAKVKQSPRMFQEAERVRMMSETPEFVIKSAIGQFLTRAFPSTVPTISNTSGRTKEDRKEDLQRMRLLRIKTCMEHLAAVA